MSDPANDPARSGHGGQRRSRFLRMSALLGALAIVGILVVGLLPGPRERIDRATSAAIAEGVSRITQGVVGVLGQLPADEADRAYGLSRFVAQLGVWEPVEPGEVMDGALGEHPVLLVHGLDEPGGIWDQLAPALSADGHTVLRFDYRNDQAIVRSADELAIAFDQIERAGVRELDLVCHSMGGLVAREVLQRDDYGSRGLRVRTLITLGTPHGGSPWARLRSIAEAREQIQRWAESDDLDPMRLFGFVDDGAGQAGNDLMPGSAFLRSLDAGVMPDDVRVICIVGRTDQPSTLVGTVGSAAGRNALRELLGPDESGTILDEIDRLGLELGDGVVPVSSAALEGADEVIEVRANHRGMVRTIELEEAVRRLNGLAEAAVPPAIPLVLERLHRD